MCKPPLLNVSSFVNPLEQRVAKKVNGQITEKYLWADLTTLLAVYDTNDNLVQRYNYTDQRVPTSMTMDNETYYLHYDQVGTLRAITDQNQNIIKEITYDTFGNITTDTNPDFTIPFGFAGGLQDQDTNLVHFGYREYDPQTGKWTSKDPIDFSGGDSNLYGYVLNDPVNFVDPEGLMSARGAIGTGMLWYSFDQYAQKACDMNISDKNVSDYQNSKKDFFDKFNRHTKEFHRDTIVPTNRVKR